MYVPYTECMLCWKLVRSDSFWCATLRSCNKDIFQMLRPIYFNYSSSLWMFLFLKCLIVILTRIVNKWMSKQFPYKLAKFRITTHIRYSWLVENMKGITRSLLWQMCSSLRSDVYLYIMDIKRDGYNFFRDLSMYTCIFWKRIRLHYIPYSLTKCIIFKAGFCDDDCQHGIEMIKIKQQIAFIKFYLIMKELIDVSDNPNSQYY